MSSNCQMVPSFLDQDYRENAKSRAEIKLYDAFSSKLSKDFYVYYSQWWFNTLDPSIRQQDGEADFIIVHQDLGAIFIEVKGGIITRDDDGRWYSNKTNKIQDPIMQSRNCKYHFRRKFQKRYKEKFGNKRLISPYFAHFAFFPDSEKPMNKDLGEGLEIEQFGFKSDIEDLAKRIYDFFLYKPTGIETNQHDKLGEEGLEIFEDMFHKALDFTPKLSQRIKANAMKIDELTSEQKNLQNQFSHWKRLWIEGPAGSGKTSLAFHKLINSKDLGVEKAIFLCRNRILSDHIQQKINTEMTRYSKYESKTFDKFSLDLSGLKSIDNREEVIRRAIENVDSNDVYDLVIVDEAQDFEESWWELIEKITSKETILWVFSDSNQRIWNTSKPILDGIDLPVKLFDVLRNTQEISKLALNFYDGRGRELNLKGPSGPQVSLVQTSDYEKSISNRVKSLTSYEGLKLNQITILYQDVIGSSIVDDIISNQILDDIPITSDFGNWSESVFISSIFKFKGMESDALILLIEDLDRLSDEQLYVAITRARSLLILLCSSNNVIGLKKRLAAFTN